MRVILALSAMVLFTSGAHAQQSGAALLLPADLVWTEVVPGVEFAAAEGDWAAEAHKKYIRIAGGTELPVHIHSAGAHIVVISGDFTHTYATDKTAKPLGAGTYIYVPGNVQHANSCVSQTPCILFTVYDGAFDFHVSDGQ